MTMKNFGCPKFTICIGLGLAVSLGPWIAFGTTKPALSIQCPKDALDSAVHALAEAYGLDPNWQDKLGSSELREIRTQDRGSFTGIGYDAALAHEFQNYRLNLRFEKTDGHSTDFPVYRTAPMQSSGFPYPEFLGETWHHQGRSYRFVNAGSSSLKQDAHLIQARLEEGQRAAPRSTIEIPMHPRWVRGKQTLEAWQDWASWEATQAYADRKPYLSPEDLMWLRIFDSVKRGGNDYMVLLKDCGKHILTMTSDDFRENVLAIGRVARMRESDPSLPEGVLWGSNTAFDSLPHHFRRGKFDTGKLQSVLGGIQRFKSKRVSEISRFINFDPNTPPEILDQFVSRLFMSTQSPHDPVDIILISTDKFTRRHFKGRYPAFKDLLEVDTGDPEHPEFLLYLDKHDPEFKTLQEQLRKSAEDLRIETVNSAPPEETWVKPWRLPEGYLEPGPLPREKKKGPR